jgi:hypothetical protein
MRSTTDTEALTVLRRACHDWPMRYAAHNRREFRKAFFVAGAYGLAAIGFSLMAKRTAGLARIGATMAALACAAASSWTALFMGVLYRLIDSVGGPEERSGDR